MSVCGKEGGEGEVPTDLQCECQYTYRLFIDSGMDSVDMESGTAKPLAVTTASTFEHYIYVDFAHGSYNESAEKVRRFSCSPCNTTGICVPSNLL